MDKSRSLRLSPWVTRLVLTNGAVFLLLATVFTAPRFATALAFDPLRITERPWTVITHLFAHRSLLHLALTTVLLVAFGPPVERMLGSKRFLGFYLYSGVGAALFALSLSAIIRIEPLVGPTGALFGVLVAFSAYWPEARLSVFSFPATVSARVLILGLIVADTALGFLGRSAIAHFSHFGGALAGYAFVRLQALTARRAPTRPAPVPRRPVVTPMRVQEAAAELRPAMPIADSRPELGNDEVDRVLDKIAEFGIDSLTSQERKFLNDAAERKRREQS
jgi:membrane associated rhomboid family serine protease